MRLCGSEKRKNYPRADGEFSTIFLGRVYDNFVQRWLSSISSSPVIFIAMTKSIAPERNNGIGTFDSPMHS